MYSNGEPRIWWQFEMLTDRIQGSNNPVVLPKQECLITFHHRSKIVHYPGIF